MRDAVGGDPGRVSRPEALDALDQAQVEGLADMDPERFRTAAHAVVDGMADYLATVERRPVLPAIAPGSIRPALPAAAPEEPEPLGAILADLDRLVVPSATHWQHPGFLAYFATSASAPGILGEMWTAVLGQNPMLWRTSPIGTELEQVVVGWLRAGLGLPPAFDGLLTDTASTSTLIALAAAREAAGLRAAADGLAARVRGGTPVVYTSTEGHSSIEKACMTLGIGRAGLRRVPVDASYLMRPDLLAGTIAEDRAAGRVPIAIVATIGTTSSTSVDPVAEIAGVASREGLWLHVDAAYAGAVALVPERRGPFAGWERADSIVVNPHKWLFTPLDASLLLARRLEEVRAAFSLVPEYLRTLDQELPVHDFTEYQPQLGRRMRALKLWMQLRYFGLAGLRRRIDAHCRLAEELAAAVDADPDFERLAPAPFSTVCLRWRPARLAGREDEPDVRARLDDANERLMAAVNATGEVFLSHTRLHDRFAIRVAIGNLRTEARHVDRAWELLRREAAALDA
jgi:aromatic-L-amino-acid/L-tryptophan decarboxylase